MNQPPKVKVFVEGRYKKLTRDLPQTVFFCPDCKGHPRRRRGCTRCEGFGKLTRDSVQELVGWVLGKALGTRKHKFHGAGREDVDVRMLGEGRPFIMELVGPKVQDADLAAIEAEINRRNEGRLEVRGLHWTEKPRVRAIKEGVFAKEYRARVAIEGEVDPARVEEVVGKRVTLAQMTPGRVAHRRAEKVRSKWIELRSIEADPDGQHWTVHVVSEHGTYVKEAISGEGGQTKPSLGELLGGVTCQCIELDVMAILDQEGGESVIVPGTTNSAAFGKGL